MKIENITRIGIDIGNVIVGGDTDEPDLFFTKRYLETPPVAGAFEGIARLAELYGAENLFLVSKCGESVEGKSRKWLRTREFTELTGIPDEQFHFCRTRPEKRGIAIELDLHAFIDDRFTVIEHLLDLPGMHTLLLFAPRGKERNLFRAHPHAARVTEVRDWEDVLEYLEA